ncbi:polyprenyl diphosphate synthase [Xanthobacter sp. KR7-225]|uniref:polyprenyl diphosphate synthase n=1 Tax=Xanthobacter sp. KR7-225 TaxID=3156613 RepID=UPI0032B36C7A
MQSSLPDKIHAALIMDGNGRWAARRGLPRTAGHEAGTHAARRIVAAAPAAGIGTLTLYAFSCDNWARPAAEVSALMALLSHFLLKETEDLAKAGVRASVIGRRDRLPGHVRDAIDWMERRTSEGRALHLRIAIDYSGRQSILAAAHAAAGAALDADAFGRLVAGADVPPVDLLIRAGGEKRLSDFLLWECAYAELSFCDVLWPDFCAAHLEAAVADFRGRERRFGALPSAA